MKIFDLQSLSCWRFCEIFVREFEYKKLTDFSEVKSKIVNFCGHFQGYLYSG